MTNAEKFRTADERARAFEEWCRNRTISACCTDAQSCGMCRFSWLDLEAEEVKIEDCPYCGHRCVSVDGSKIRPDRHGVRPYSYVKCESCGYESMATNDYGKSGVKDIVAAHNRVARAVMDAGKKEDK